MFMYTPLNGVCTWAWAQWANPYAVWRFLYPETTRATDPEESIYRSALEGLKTFKSGVYDSVETWRKSRLVRGCHLG